MSTPRSTSGLAGAWATCISTAPPYASMPEPSHAPLTAPELHYFNSGLGAPTPARRLESCLRWALRSSGRRLDLNALQNALLALGARDHLHPESSPLRDALRLVALTRSVFGDAMPPAPRCAWHSAMHMDLSDTQSTPDAVWARRDTIAAAVQSLCAAVSEAERPALAKKVLMVAAAAAPPLDALQAFLRHHAAFGMTLAEFITFTLGPRSDTWLKGAPWESLSALADALAPSGAHARELLRGLLDLRRSDLQQVTLTLTDMCSRADASTQAAIRLALFDAIAKLGCLPINGVTARMFLAAFQTDDALLQLAQAPTSAARKALLKRLAAEAQARAGNTENVHNAVRIRATEAALVFLRGLDESAPMQPQAILAAMDAYIEHLRDNRPTSDVWFRVRNVGGRTTLDNARYVLSGPYHPSGPDQVRDLSRSVAETPAYMEICALVWRAIALYKHPSGTAAATANEQTQMREAMILGLAECVKDATGYRVCPVGFKQRVIGILQGDDRYPQVLVDAVNAAQLLTVVGQEFAHELQERQPTRDQLAAFQERSRATAAERFADEPRELDKFNTDLDAWLAYDYPAPTGSQPG